MLAVVIRLFPQLVSVPTVSHCVMLRLSFSVDLKLQLSILASAQPKKRQPAPDLGEELVLLDFLRDAL